VLSIKLVHPPELRSFVSEQRDRFHSTDPRLADGENEGRGSKVVVELISEMSIPAAERIARGDLKPEAWLASSTSIVNYANSQLRNLGARQGECRPLFGTPIVVAVKQAGRADFDAIDHTFSWDEVLEARLLERRSNASQSRLAMTHASPRLSTTGFAALLQLGYFAVHSGTSGLSIEGLAQHGFQTRLRDYQSFVSSYGLSEGALLGRAENHETARTRLVLTTEQQVANYNLGRINELSTPDAPYTGPPPIVALYPREGAVWEDYQLCLSQSDWMGTLQRNAAQMLQKFLASPESQLRAKQLGFRPSSNDLAEVPPLTTRYGIMLSEPRNSFLPVSGEVVSELQRIWPAIQRPAAFVVVLDSSGSMEGEPHRVAREQFRNLLAQSSVRDQKALITFTNRPRIEANFTANSLDVSSKLDQVQSLGGSSIYDSLRAAVELIVASDLREYRKSIILITDGDDKNSDLSRQGLIDLLVDKFARNDITLIIIGIQGSASSFSDLEEIAKAANGVFRATTVQNLPVVFAELAGNVQGGLEP